MDYIVVHCSDSPQGRGDNAATLHAWHKQRGFAGIGYHFVVLEDGTVENGRPIYWEGAHVEGHNKNSIGICLIGKDKFTDKQLSAAKKLVADLQKKHGGKVVGHRDLDSKKTCPNFDVKKWLKS